MCNIWVVLSLPSYERCSKSMGEKMQGRQIIFLSVLTTALWAAALRQTLRPLYGVWSCRIGVEWTESLHMVTQTSSWSPLLHCPALLSLTRYSSCKENTEKVGVQEALRWTDGRERGKNVLFWCCLLVAFKGSKLQRTVLHALNF